MRALATAWLFAAACGAAAKPTTNPPPDNPAATCDDVAAHVAALDASAGEGLDAGGVGRECAEEPWPEDTIACVVAATSLDAARECIYARARGGEACQALAALIDASRSDPPFAGVQGAEIEADAGIHELTIGLPGAQCQLAANFEDRAYAVCEILSGDDGDRALEAYNGAANLVRACLSRDTWTLDDTGDNELVFVNDQDDTVAVQAASDLGSWWVYVVVGESD